MNRELDCEIAEIIYGWKLVHVGPDAQGGNECDILSPDGKLPQGFELPRRGKIHRAYLCPQYSSDWQTAISLARRVQLRSSVSGLTTPEDLAEACLIVWQTDHGLPAPRWNRKES